MTAEAVDELVARGIVRRTEPDREAAARELATAKVHLESAASLAAEDPVAAFAIVYDAARKAISAHMRARGLRVEKGHGAHARVGEYAAAALDGPDVTEHLERFDDMRRLRNLSEYDALLLDEADVADALRQASAIVSAVEKDLVR